MFHWVSSQQLQLQQVGKSENVKVLLGGGVDPAKKEVPTKGVVFFAFVKVASEKRKVRHSKFLGVSTFFGRVLLFEVGKWDGNSMWLPPKKILLRIDLDQNNNPFFLFCFFYSSQFLNEKRGIHAFWDLFGGKNTYLENLVNPFLGGNWWFCLVLRGLFQVEF